MSDFQNSQSAQIDAKLGPNWDSPTAAEAEAVDAGVQEALPKDARWHRREARRLLIGKPGMSDDQKLARMDRAIDHLTEAKSLLLDTMIVKMDDVAENA